MASYKTTVIADKTTKNKTTPLYKVTIKKEKGGYVWPTTFYMTAMEAGDLAQQIDEALK